MKANAFSIRYEQVKATQDGVLSAPVTELATSEESSRGDRVVPGALRSWLAQLRLLQNLPFAYLAPDSDLLPPESIRFFHLDRAWTDALVQGALSVGTVSSADRAELEGLYRWIRDEIDEEERALRSRPEEPPGPGPAGPITGFLLRSRAVSAYPGLHVRAYRADTVDDKEIVPESDPDRLRLLRLERLAPAVLLALFDGVPKLVHLEEPRVGVQFGVRLEKPKDGGETRSAWVPARDAKTAEALTPEVKVPVTFRKDSPGVLDLQRTGAEFANKGANLSADLDGAELALEMIRYPFRQIFGEEKQPRPELVFRPTIGARLTDLIVAFGGKDG